MNIIRGFGFAVKDATRKNPGLGNWREPTPDVGRHPAGESSEAGFSGLLDFQDAAAQGLTNPILPIP